MKIYFKSSIFTQDSLTANEVYLTYPPIMISCAICGDQIGFVLKNFDKYSFNKTSHLTREDDLKITKFAEKHEKKLAEYPVNSFIDYYCPICKTPIRIYFQAWAGGRFTHGYVVHYIIE